MTTLAVVLTVVAPSGAQTDLSALPAESDASGPNEPQRALKAGKVVRAIRVATPPTIDGRLDDEPWIVAPIATGLVQRDPDNGSAMTRATRVQFAYDDRYLYVAVTNVDDSGDTVATGLGRRDEQPPTDMVTIGFDPRHDHQTGYAFQTNPSGWQGDFSTTDDDRNDRDYNAVWDVRTAVTTTGWNAEFRIPFSQVRFTASPEPGQVWEETTILGAAKLTGKSSQWTYGALTAVTGREFAAIDTPVVDGSGFTRQERLIEPATSYNVVRLQRDIGSSNIGGLVTGVMREKADDAFTGGFDYNLRWDANRTRFDGHWAITHAPGPDGIKTSGGGVTNFNVSRKHFNTGGHYDHFGRDFRVNDIGFMRVRANRSQANGYAEVGQPDPWKALRRVWSWGSYSQSWTDEGLLIERAFETGVSFQLLNYWNFNGGTGRNGDVYDDLDTRGGPPIFDPGNNFVFFNANSDSRKSWRLNFGGNRWKDAVGGSGGNQWVGFNVQPTDRIQASVSANYNAGTDSAQWIVNQDADGDGITDYVYGTLKRDVLDLTFRGTYAFTRDLTLQAYVQPFIAVGDYYDIRKLALPYSYVFSPVTISYDPDFNTKSLRGNVVLRWEYVRGSTLFVVWDLSQADYARPGVFRPWSDIRTAFSAEAAHTLMVKVSYWINQ